MYSKGHQIEQNISAEKLVRWFDNPPDRKGTHTFKWDYNLAKFGREDVIPLWIADMDFAVAEEITEALKARTEHPVYGYSYRTKSYTEAILGWLDKRHNWQLNASQLLFYPPGTVAAIHTLVNLFSEVTDEIIVQTPSYPPLTNIVRETGRQLIENPLILKDNEYVMDFKHLEGCFTSKTKLLILCSPHNPTGRVWRESELEKLASLCKQHNVMVISDEVHADLLLEDGQHCHFNRINTDKRGAAVTLISACKTFNIAALPQSTLICDDKNIRQIVKHAIDTSHLNLDGVFSATAAQAGYIHGEIWLNHLLFYISRNRDRLKNFIDKFMPQVVLVEAQGTYLAWLDFRQLKLSQVELSNIFVFQAGVGLYDGCLFGEEGNGFFRVNLACSQKLLLEAFHNIHQALKSKGAV